MAGIFQDATRKKFRFASSKGLLSVEQLWDVPLRSRDTFNLDEIARGLSASVRAEASESFVDDVPTAKAALADRHLEVVKHVIKTKLDEERNAAMAAARRVEKERILDILARKQDAALDAMSESDLKARLAALDAPKMETA